MGPGEPVEDKREKSRQDAREEVIKQKFRAAQAAFHRAPEDEEANHVKEYMAYGSGIVDKHIGNKLPYPALTHHQGYHRKIDCKIKPREEALEEIYQDVDPYEDVHRVVETITEGFSDEAGHENFRDPGLTTGIPCLQSSQEPLSQLPASTLHAA
jgi:hypothetical protein